MSKKDVSLPANYAFVVQLQASSGASDHRGRVEHLASGQAVHFANEGELWAFIDSVLITKSSGQKERTGQPGD